MIFRNETKLVLLAFAVILLTGCSNEIADIYLPRKVDLCSDLTFIQLPGTKVWFGVNEISNEQYKKYDPEHDSGEWCDFDLNGSNLPVARISYHEAQAYGKWLSNKYKTNIPSSYCIRVPRQREWILAASCGLDRPYPWGESFSDRNGNYAGNALKDYYEMHSSNSSNSFLSAVDLNYHDGQPLPAPVGEASPNELGIRGLSGNVREWCLDMKTTEGSGRFVKGLNSWLISSQDESSYNVNTYSIEEENTKSYDIGVRLVLVSRYDAVSGVTNQNGTLFK